MYKPTKQGSTRVEIDLHPDAVSNIAVAVCRATGRLGYSVAINIGILVATLVNHALAGIVGAAGAHAYAESQPAPAPEAPPEPAGRIRIEFTSPAKPALITWAAGGAQDGAAQDGRGSQAAVAAYRYLVVPLRVPAKA